MLCRSQHHHAGDSTSAWPGHSAQMWAKGYFIFFRWGLAARSRLVLNSGAQEGFLTSPPAIGDDRLMPMGLALMSVYLLL